MSGDRRDDRATDDAGERDGFLTRWSQRKAMARQGVDLPEPEEHAAMPPLADAPDVEAREETAEETAAAAAGESLPTADEPTDLPPIDSLDEDSDYSPFLAAGVSPDVQREALRKLFHSPKFNLRDGLDDYDLDFTNPEPLGDIITAEMRHRMQIELERLARLDEEDEIPEEAVAAVESDERDDCEAPDESGEPLEADDSDEQPRAS